MIFKLSMAHPAYNSLWSDKFLRKGPSRQSASRPSGTFFCALAAPSPDFPSLVSTSKTLSRAFASPLCLPHNHLSFRRFFHALTSSSPRRTRGICAPEPGLRRFLATKTDRVPGYQSFYSFAATFWYAAPFSPRSLAPPTLARRENI